MIGSSNYILPCCERLFIAISPLQVSNDQERFFSFGADLLRQQIKEALNQFDYLTQKPEINPDCAMKAKYAFIAFIDELAIRSSIEVNQAWTANPLQLEYFGEITAGQRFFTQLDELRLTGELVIDALEIYYLCLEMGFQGQYRNQDSSVLISLKHDLRTQIQTIRKNKVTSLFISALTLSTEKTKKTPISAPRVAIICASILLMSSMILICLISYQANQNRKVIINFANTMNKLE